MKQMILSLIAVLLISQADAQLIKRLGDRAKQKMENKAGEKMDKEIDKSVDGERNKKEKKPSNPSDTNTSSTDNTEKETSASDDGSPTTKEPASLKTYSKYDFIPGEKLLVYENFAQDAIGDFPGKWNTNSSGEIVSVSGREGKWFKINKTGAYYPEFITSLPDNFTFEFDLGVNNQYSFYSTELFLSLVNLTKPEEDYSNWGSFTRWNGKHAVRLSLHSTNAGGLKGVSRITTSVSGSFIIDNTVDINEFNSSTKNIVHVSIWRQNQRMRVYINNEKIWDLPKAFGQGAAYNSIVFGTGSFHREEDFFVMNNLRLAVGAPDTRNKLITEGKFVTRGILFDVNSDKIKPESYGTLKDIANVLSENGTVKVKIIGHTDTDGDEKTNMELSKKRASSVKNALINEFSIAGSRIETDGKGESQPVDKAETPVAKANNRRVEFIKL